MKPKSRRGRPPRAAASAKALAGLDLEAVDPRAILAKIAADPSAPATARVAACRALLAQPTGPAANTGPDAVTELALRLLQGEK